MRLYSGNAHEFLGKKIDRKRRLFGYYPMEVKQFPDGKYYVKDAVGVCMPLPEKEDDFNAVNFDFVVNELLTAAEDASRERCPAAVFIPETGNKRKERF